MKKVNMKKVVPIITLLAVLCLILLVILAYLGRSRPLGRDMFLTDGVYAKLLFNKTQKTLFSDLLKSCELRQTYQAITVDYPFDKSIFPPEIVAPTFLWHDPDPKAKFWLVDITFTDNPNHIYVLTIGEQPGLVIDPGAAAETNKHWKPSDYDQTANAWTPGKKTWSIIKHNSIGKPATVTVIGFDSNDVFKALSKGTVTLWTSKKPVAAPVFYRDVPLMPSETKEGVIKPIKKDAMPLISWKLRDISKPKPVTVLHDMPTCANCHTFSTDGSTLGMDLDGPDGDKGAYTLSAVKKEINITYDDIITWNSFEPKNPPGHKSFGLFSSVSPGGRYVVTTVNESVFVTNYQNFELIQSFYPTRGIFAVYDRQTKTMKALPGADDPNYVHTNACWSPDGKYLLFSRASAKDRYEHEDRPKYSGDPLETFIQYDLYRMPFNQGKGGAPQPFKGASNNGMSNSFPKYSPDGKWVVFVQTEKGQLMRPDSRLYIIPAEGGQARQLSCNLDLMNSWHSWSPNSRWLVFASKGLSPFTQMFLTHIDENGNSSPAVLVPNSTAANRAVNIPEFLNNKPNAIASISAPTQQAYRYKRIADKLLRQERYAAAIEEYEKSIELNPYFDGAYANLGTVFAAMGRTDEAVASYRKALEIDNENAVTHCNLGLALSQKDEFELAITHFARAEKIDPNYADTYLGWATTLNEQGKLTAALPYFRKAYQLHERKSKVVQFMVPSLVRYAAVLHRQGNGPLAIEHYREAVSIKPDDPQLQYNFAGILKNAGNFKEAVEHYRKAIVIKPDFIKALNEFAWLLATCPDAKFRNGSEAIQFAQNACQLTNYKDPYVLDCLAVAYAEIGQFTAAIETAQKALELAKQYNQSDLQQQLQTQINLFKNQQPYHQNTTK